MVLRRTMPSNKTNLRIAEEASPGVLPVTPDWFQYEPNSYQDFGADLKLVARNPINDSRQRKKGTIVDLTAAGGFESDLTSRNLSRVLEGFFFARTRTKNPLSATATTGTGYTVPAGGTAYRQNDLLLAENAVNAANNGVHVVGAGSTGTEVKVAGLVVNGADAIDLMRVGFEFDAGDAVFDATAGDLPALTTTTKDLTQLGLIPGEFVYIGGDAAGTRSVHDENNGWARVKSVAAHRIVFDKTDAEWVDDAAGAKTIRLFLGKVLKNELGSLIVPITYQLERSLGAPDTALPNAVQGEYLTRAAPNVLTFTVPEANKITTRLSFLAGDYETRTATEGLKAGNRPAVDEEDAFNSSNHIKRARMAVYPDPSANSSAPVPLFALINSMTFSVDNKLSENKAMGHVGAVEVTEGTFTVGGTLSAYFATVEATQAIRDNADVTFDFAMVQDNRGIVVDFPMIALGNGRLSVEQDKSIRIPLDSQAATGAKYDAAFDHTLCMTFFDYLPDAASVRVD
jgi:hypothetical protein